MSCSPASLHEDLQVLTGSEGSYNLIQRRAFDTPPADRPHRDGRLARRQGLMDAFWWTAPSPLPGPILTERLEIRRYETADAPALFDAVDRDRSALFPWLPWAGFAHRNEADTLEFLRDCRRGYALVDAPNFTMGVFARSDGDLRGGTGLHAPLA